MLGYTYQLYFDFAGYSNMAVGLGYLSEFQRAATFREAPQLFHRLLTPQGGVLMAGSGLLLLMILVAGGN